MRASVSPRTLLAAAGAVLALGAAAQAQQLINVSGSSLLGSFIRGQASTNDYIGVTAQTPAAGTDIIGAGVWSLNYRVSGSINGFDELFRYGYPSFVTAADDRTPGNTTFLNSLLITDEWYNRAQYITAGVTGGVYQPLNPGGQPQRAATSGADRSVSGTSGGVTIDVAYIDVPTIWGVVGPAGTPSATRKPNTPGYGQNPRNSVSIDGSATGSPSGGGWTNALTGTGTRNLADFPGRNPVTDPYDANTVFAYPLTLAPIAPIANPGTGIKRMKLTELQYLFGTGRAKTGENFVVATRSIGSGTRNGFENGIAQDPSFGVGDNVGLESTLSSQDQLGPTFWPTNKGATSGILRTLRYNRLAVGYAGAETAVSGASPSSWLSGNVLDIIDTFNDAYYTPAELASLFPSGLSPSDYVRPTLANILDNTRTGWVITGQAHVCTIGDPKAEANTFRMLPIPNDGGRASGNPAMVNKSAARYVNNILRSIDDFNATTPVGSLVATPAEFLAGNFTLIGSADHVIDPVSQDPQSRVPNPNFNPFAKNFALGAGNSVFQSPRYSTPNTNSFPGLSPRRFPLASGTYSDGLATTFITQGTTGTNGNTVAYEASSDSTGRPVMDRNKIAFDFNGDGVRTTADAPDMIAAWRQRQAGNTGPAWVAPSGAAGAGQDAVIEILGDANGDGSFTSEDIRYWADGLAVTSAGGNLNRRAGFIAVDNAFGGNFFGAILAPAAANPTCGKAYASGDSRADVAGPSGRVAPGWAPVGHDGRVDGWDIDYVYKQFRQTGITGCSADWSDINEAARFDLSADMNGDLSVNQADVTEIVENILGTCYGDVNLDGVVNTCDLNIVTAAAAAGLGTPGHPFNPAQSHWSQGDLNGDGVVNAADIALVCIGDINCSGSISVQDIFDFLGFYFAGSCRADVNCSGANSVQDIFDFLGFYFAGGCPAPITCP